MAAATITLAGSSLISDRANSGPGLVVLAARFLITDIVGGVSLWERDADLMSRAVAPTALPVNRMASRPRVREVIDPHTRLVMEAGLHCHAPPRGPCTSSHAARRAVRVGDQRKSRSGISESRGSGVPSLVVE